MKTKRTILFRIGAVLILFILAGIMMVIGRGHTVYIDNKSLDYNGQTYAAPYKAVVIVNGEQAAKLRSKERGMATCIGQRFHMTLKITQKKGGSEETINVTLTLPYQMDGIAINLPAYLAGLPKEVYLSRFQIAPEESGQPAEEIPSDELHLGDI